MAFLTKFGLFECLVMFFDLCNLLAMFQTIMNIIFYDLIITQVMAVYIDDIIIFTKIVEKH
ncbi:hypothetical protein HETIRDRAFT_321629 [Heterobasidion irregulare TC 32-1]|uniref:Reverse transcriptase domain-containing protein n=1 Tax=Heterobasidion irregulare (strain TC 32-1) TaxID=747525 RepID=W4K3L7_HETIT|nr:uncharacterized protein HETIRDRAFT_321629 [Heterobasidion irregulare TC 32-1]ETW79930.1 hypothetical protein HETIRDRAFT_321629 [Heterobasidion irregulare TC 32-1]